MQVVEVRVPGSELLLAPVGDVQYGAQGCDADKLARHVRYGLEHDWWFLGMGDYLDHFSPSNRRALATASVGLYESAAELIDRAVGERIEELASGPLAGSAGRWLGLIQGDHEHVFLDGTHSDDRLARSLRAPFFGSAVLLDVYLGDCPRPLKIWATHGRGASVSSTGKTLHLERIAQAFDADVYLMAHSHLKYGYPLDRLKSARMPDGRLKLVHETKVLGITGSWLNGYQQNSRSLSGFPQGGYVERGAMRPVPTGGLLISARPVEEEWGWRWDMFVSS